MSLAFDFRRLVGVRNTPEALRHLEESCLGTVIITKITIIMQIIYT